MPDARIVKIISEDSPETMVALISRELEPIGCSVCGNLVNCTCSIAKEHKPECRYRIAAELSFELACDHGFQACPICDPCNCGIEVAGIK